MDKKIEAISDKFQLFLDTISVPHREYIMDCFHNIARRINLTYWYTNSDTRNTHFIGSYGRGTAITGVANINIMVVLPDRIYKRFAVMGEKAPINVIKNVRETVADAYPLASIQNDCHLMVPAIYDIKFEVIPAFVHKKAFMHPDPKDPQGWKIFNPLREIEVVEQYNFKYQGKIKHLGRIMRAWKAHQHVPISGMLLDTMILSFMDEWEWNDKSFGYYNVMVRDFLEYLAGRKDSQNHWYAIGSNRELLAPEHFGDQANAAYKTAARAVDLEYVKNHVEANTLWREIFGDIFPNLIPET